MNLYVVFQLSDSNGLATGRTVFSDCGAPRSPEEVTALHDALKEEFIKDQGPDASVIVLNWIELPA